MKYLDLLMKKPEFFGVQRFCNICCNRFSKFGLFNKTLPREAQCPVCGSLERHRHLSIHLLSLFPFLDNKRVLHFAPEEIIKEILASSKAEYFDADLDPAKAKYKVDITNIPFENNFFDYIICIHVLEHIPDDSKAMAELYRVLKSGGTAFLSVPLTKEHLEDLSVTDPEERTRLFGQFDHVRHYSLEIFKKRLSKVGFDTQLVSSPDLFPENMRDAKLGDRIFLARKV